MPEPEPRQAAIEVIAIRAYDGSGSLKAFCDVRIGGVTLKGCKIVQQEGRAAWLATPSVKTDHGWQNIAELSRPLRERVTAVVLAEWQAKEQRVEASAQPIEDTPFHDDWCEAVADLEGRGR